MLVLENSAGGGGGIGVDVDEIAALLDAIAARGVPPSASRSASTRPTCGEPATRSTRPTAWIAWSASWLIGSASNAWR